MTNRNALGQPTRERVLVFGGRDLNPVKVRDWLSENALELLRISELKQIDLVIQGGAAGGDEGGKLWAKRHFLPMREYPAQWSKHGRAAGPIRNQEMLDEGRPTSAIGFPGGRGTQDMLKRIRDGVRRGMPCRLYLPWDD